MRILIVEDDERVADALSSYLGRVGYDTCWSADGASAIDRLQRQAQGGAGSTTSADPAVDAVLLDLGLPDIDGLEVCRTVRGSLDIPIIIATARSAVDDRIRGLRAGADDFVVKPYDVRELVARVEAVTRRTAPAPSAADDATARSGITIGDVHIDEARHAVAVGGEPIELTPKEYDILIALARYPGVVVPRERLIREVWGTDWRGFSRSLEVHVGSLRNKLGNPALIATARGVGYRIAEPSARPAPRPRPDPAGP